MEIDWESLKEINCQLANCTPSQLHAVAAALLSIRLLRDDMERTDRGDSETWHL